MSHHDMIVNITLPHMVIYKLFPNCEYGHSYSCSPTVSMDTRTAVPQLWVWTLVQLFSLVIFLFRWVNRHCFAED